MEESDATDLVRLLERLQELRRRIAERYMEGTQPRDPVLFELLDEMEQVALLLCGKLKNGNGAPTGK